jgi:hypothetical protein
MTIFSRSKSCSSATAPAAWAAAGPAWLQALVISARASGVDPVHMQGSNRPASEVRSIHSTFRLRPSGLGLGSITTAPAPSDRVKRRKSASIRVRPRASTRAVPS